MRDIAVVVEHGTPFLFPDAEDSMRKMKSLVQYGDSTVSATAEFTLFCIPAISLHFHL